MRSLMLFRHAKSDWNADVQTDFDRPLAPRGKVAAQMMGRFVKATGNQPDLILTSPAVRARTTVEIAAAAGGWSGQIEEHQSIYEAATITLERLISDQDSRVENVMIVGHNPALELTVQRFLGGGQFRLPTAAIAFIQFGADSWAEAVSTNGTLLWLVTPKLLKKAGFE